MSCKPPTVDINVLLQEIRDFVSRDSPQLLTLFDVFAQEARFAREWLSPNLRLLSDGESILEVGAGLMLVSCQLMREGYRVTALEPVGEGFSAFFDLQKRVLAYAVDHDIAPEVLPLPVEKLDQSGVYGFAFSVNVMEHVADVSMAIRNVGRSLRTDCSYRFTCPNYLFPYEPHFNMPTLFSKALTEKWMWHRIVTSRQVQDQVGLWNSLNWITVPVIRQACATVSGLVPVFDRSMLVHTFQRVVDDPAFAARRSVWVRVIAAWMVRSGLHKALSHLPSVVQPVIDCTVRRCATGPTGMISEAR